MYKTICVAVDGSDNSMRAVEQAAMLAAAGEGSKLVMLSVINIDVYSDMVYDPIEAHGDAQRDKIEPAADIARAQGVEPEVKILHGRPAEELVRATEKLDADLLVLGSRGLNTLQQFTLGSVSHKALKHAACPVLIVK